MKLALRLATLAVCILVIGSGLLCSLWAAYSGSGLRPLTLVPLDQQPMQVFLAVFAIGFLFVIAAVALILMAARWASNWLDEVA